MKYKVGDKVRIVSKWAEDGSCVQNDEGLMDQWLGSVMTVTRANNLFRLYRMAEDGGRWAWRDSCIAGLAVDHKIVITSDGTTTTARMYNGGKRVSEAMARCSKDDEFDFGIGAKLAMGRLLGAKNEAEEFYPVEAIKAGYLIVVSDGNRQYNMTVLPGKRSRLACCCPGENAEYCPLDMFDSNLDYHGAKIMAVYGFATNKRLMDNATDGRDLMWARKGFLAL